MVDLLALRDQAKGAAAKRDIKLHIDAWTRQYDKLSRGSKVGKPITGPAVDAWQAARSPASDSPQSGTSPADSPSSPPGIGPPTPTDIIKAELNPNRQQAAADNNPEVSRGSTAADSIQAGLDAVGVVGDAVVPGLGVAADGVNAVMSLGRAVTDPGRAGQHLSNAAISAVSMVPLIGDSAKLLKAGQYSKLAGRVADAGKSRRAGEAAGSATAAASGASTGMTGGGSGGGGANGGTGSPGPGDEGERGGGFMDAVSSATDTLLRFVGPVGKLIIGFETIYASLQAMNAGVLALNRDLAEYNGNVAATYAMSDAHEIERKVERGESLSGPLDRLAKQQREANEIRDSIMNPLMNIGIDILAMITWIANQVQEILLTLFFVREILDILIWMKDWIISWFGASGSNNPLDDLPAAQQFFTDLMDGKLDGKMPSFFTMGGSQ